jgi:PleD family two-component response regulator
LKTRSAKNGLTGLANRRATDRTLATEWLGAADSKAAGTRF